MTRNNIMILALGWLLLAIPFAAKSACVSADSGGKWHAFLVTGSALFQGFAKASMEFSGSGELIGNRSQFINSFNQRFRLTKGRLKVNDSCRVTGSFSTTAGVKINIVDGQMNSGKDVISGVYRSSSKDNGLINLIK